MPPAVGSSWLPAWWISSSFAYCACDDSSAKLDVSWSCTVSRFEDSEEALGLLPNLRRLGRPFWASVLSTNIQLVASFFLPTNGIDAFTGTGTAHLDEMIGILSQNKMEAVGLYDTAVSNFYDATLLCSCTSLLPCWPLCRNQQLLVACSSQWIYVGAKVLDPGRLWFTWPL